MMSADFFRRFRFEKTLTLGLGIGLFIPAAKALCNFAVGGLDGIVLLELMVLLLAVGLAGVPSPRILLYCLAAVEPFLPALMAITAALVGHGAAPRGLMIIIAWPAGGLALFIWGRRLRLLLETDLRRWRRALTWLCLGGALASVSAVALLPLAGPFALLLAALLVNRPVRNGGARAIAPTAAAALVLAAAAVADGVGYIPEQIRPAERPPAIVRRVWFSDGPDRMLSVKRKGLKIEAAAGTVQWFADIEKAGYRKKKRRLSLSVWLANELAPKGRALGIGPSSVVFLRERRARDEREKTMVIPDRRIGWWVRQTKKRGHGGDETPVVADIRSFLSDKKGRYQLIFYKDPFDAARLAAGELADFPAAHLTVETVAMYIKSLAPDGTLILEVPYSLRMTAILREVAEILHMDLRQIMVAYGRRRGERDIIAVRPAGFSGKAVYRINKKAIRYGFEVYYHPGRTVITNDVHRLAVTKHRRGHYASSSEEYSPPTDNRPFYYQIQRMMPRTRKDRPSGLLPVQDRRFLWLWPRHNLPWLAQMLAAAAAIGALAAGHWRRWRKAGCQVHVWDIRLGLSVLAAGGALALFVRAGMFTVLRQAFSGGHSTPLTAAIALAALAAGMIVAVRTDRNFSTALLVRAWLLGPLVFLPLGVRFLMDNRIAPLNDLFALVVSIPPALVVGMGVVQGCFSLSRRHDSLSPAALTALIIVGIMAGLETAPPVAYTFGLPFTLLLSWLAVYVAVRAVRRVPFKPIAAAGAS